MGKIIIGIILGVLGTVGYNYAPMIMMASQMADKDLYELFETCENTNMNMVRCKVIEDIDSDDVIESMKLRANMLNFKLVGHLPLSEQVIANGGESERMEIFQFCDASVAAEMVKENMAFAGYLPCRITLVERGDDIYLITINMDTTMSDASLPAAMVDMGIDVRNNIYEIMSAGAEGDL
jgi:uncharacterized protein (DUF302 family)